MKNKYINYLKYCFICGNKCKAKRDNYYIYAKVYECKECNFFCKKISFNLFKSCYTFTSNKYQFQSDEDVFEIFMFSRNYKPEKIYSNSSFKEAFEHFKMLVLKYEKNKIFA